MKKEVSKGFKTLPVTHASNDITKKQSSVSTVGTSEKRDSMLLMNKTKESENPYLRPVSKQDTFRSISRGILHRDYLQNTGYMTSRAELKTSALQKRVLPSLT